MDDKNDSGVYTVGSVGIFFVIAKFVLLPLAVCVFYAVLGFFMWAIDILPGPGWVSALAILFGLVTYGWLSLKIEDWRDRRKRRRGG
ncbi:MAG: hypothetical protein JRJ03_18485 [Deltaproteobacteria bacterium]|nr:hypothetical protein [Deltaproteobacteria bacterium]